MPHPLEDLHDLLELQLRGGRAVDREQRGVELHSCQLHGARLQRPVPLPHDRFELRNSDPASVGLGHDDAQRPRRHLHLHHIVVLSAQGPQELGRAVLRREQRSGARHAILLAVRGVAVASLIIIVDLWRRRPAANWVHHHSFLVANMYREPPHELLMCGLWLLWPWWL